MLRGRDWIVLITEYGITEADLMEAAGGDLKAYMLAELNRAVDHAVEDRG
jgi:hypothetical protein